VQTSGKPQLQWRDFTDLSASLLYQVLRFRQSIFVVEQACAFPDLDGLDQRAHHLLLYTGSALAGYLRLLPDTGEHRIAIGRVAVSPGWRRRGYGRLLMMEALARCRPEYPDCRVTLAAQTYLVGFYESLGFRPTSAPFEDYGLMHVNMQLDAG
jgi:ElaA protein